jgi:hypothetical protein
LGGGDQCPQTIIQELPVILFKLSRHQIWPEVWQVANPSYWFLALTPWSRRMVRS